ncbi:hypothetical protein PQQ65_10875 [Paraburkholderia strydomiana]|uniref:hypothetical protein n=1 Tax=Paraburkholderia strydomiana TaxID=1245417 RepID=UPI0038BB2280
MKSSSASAATAAGDGSSIHAHVDASTFKLAEVWGDTVDLRHLAWSVALGVAISVAAFEAGKAVLSSAVSDAAIVRAYAMLIGLGGCLAAGALSAFFFKPKRVVTDHTVGESDRQHVLKQLAEEGGGIGSIADLPPNAAAELKELGLYDLFAAYELSEQAAQAKGER